MNVSPSLPPLLCMKSGKVYCFYTYANQWDEVKKRSRRVPGSTKCVGKILGGNKFGQIEWKDDFISEHTELEHLISTRNDDGTITYEPVEDDISISKIKETQILDAGATWVFDNLIKDTPLAKALSRAFPKYNDYKKYYQLHTF